MSSYDAELDADLAERRKAADAAAALVRLWNDQDFRNFAQFICGYNPEIVAEWHGNYVGEPREHHRWSDLTTEQRGQAQAAWLNSRGGDFCSVCLAPRDNGVCRWCPPQADRAGEPGGAAPDA